MKKVLIISHIFPPSGGIGVQRVLKFAKYLPQFGWQPVILTVAQSASFMRDDTLLQELSPSLQVYRSSSWEPFNAALIKQATEQFAATTGGLPKLKQALVARLRPLYFALRIPDDKIGWWPFAVQLGRKVMELEKIDLLFATAPPYTSLLVARSLKRSTGKPLVVDYRDEWSTMQYQDYPTNPVTIFLNRQLEQSVLNVADAVVTATPGIRENLQRAGLLRPATVNANIMNGFDPDDYHLEQPPEKNDCFTIVYTGSLYGERRSPVYFLQALAQLLQAKPAIRNRIKISLVGTIYEKHARLIQEYNVEDVVQLIGMVSHQQAIRYQLTADVLLLIVGNGPGSEVVLTGKIFEYFGAGCPILALAPLDGPVAKLIHQTATGCTVDSEDVNAICKTLDELYQVWATGKQKYQPNRMLLSQFSRLESAKNLACIFDGLAGG